MEERRKKMEKVENIKKMLGGDSVGPQPLFLNQIIAKQVMEKTRKIAAEAAQGKPINKMDEEAKDENLSDSSPDVPLPLRQQRESFLI